MEILKQQQQTRQREAGRRKYKDNDWKLVLWRREKKK